MRQKVRRQWLRTVDDDLRAVHSLLTGAEPTTTAAAYHCRQAVEKLVKSILVADQIHPPTKHEIGDLIDSLRPDHPLRPLLDGLDEFTRFVWVFRYPGPAGNDGPENPPSVQEVERWLADLRRRREQVVGWFRAQGLLDDSL